MPIEILDPTVAPDPVAGLSRAPRPETLAGRRVWLLDNGKRNSARLLEHLAAAIRRQYPVAEVALRTKPSASTGLPPELLAEFQNGCDAAIAGIGD